MSELLYAYKVYLLHRQRAADGWDQSFNGHVIAGVLKVLDMTSDVLTGQAEGSSTLIIVGITEFAIEAVIFWHRWTLAVVPLPGYKLPHSRKLAHTVLAAWEGDADDACMHSQCPWGCPKGGIAVELRLSWHDFKSNCYDLYVLVVFVLGFPVWCLLGCERWVNDHFRHPPEPHEDHWQHTRRGTHV